MRIEMQKMLNEFIERDFTLEEMKNVMEALHSLYEDGRMAVLAKNRQDYEMAVYWLREEENAHKEAVEVLGDLYLEYDPCELFNRYEAK